MHAQQVLHNLFSNSALSMHGARKKILIEAVKGCLSSESLSLTTIGRHLEGHATTKSNIKRIDRLLSNETLFDERFALYQLTIDSVLSPLERPVIIVDWSTLEGKQGLYLLRAAAPLSGRAMTLYEEVHGNETYNTVETHQTFLWRLNRLLPESAKPIIITDAGFRTSWFKAVSHLGWDFIGRERNNTHYRRLGCNEWQPCKSLQAIAKKRVRYVSTIEFSKKQKFPCELFIKKVNEKNYLPPPPRKKYSGRSKTYMRYRGAVLEALILITSLKGGNEIAERVIHLYKQRMQIEAAFRDLKSHRFGIALSEARTKNPKRYQILLLIALLATLILWLLGAIARKRNISRQFQANSIKDKTVLSITFIGREMIRRYGDFKIQSRDYVEAILTLRNMFERCSYV